MDIHIFAVSSASSKIMSCAPTTSTTEDTVTIENFGVFSLNTCFLSYTCFLICYVVIAQIYHCLLPFSFSDSLIQDVRDLLGSGAEQPLPSHWRNRQTSSLENWTVLRPFMVNNMLSSEKPKEGVCHHCGHKAAVVMCRDCLPRSLYCTACDLSTHEALVLHNRASMVEGFFRHLPPSTFVQQHEGGKFSYHEKGSF